MSETEQEDRGEDEIPPPSASYRRYRDILSESTLSEGDVSNRIQRAKNVTLIGGPFHYNIRSGTYGEPYDEVPWQVRIGMAVEKPRHGYPENCLVCNYQPKVLINTWVEDRKTRNFMKYDKPFLSEYGYHYESETTRAFRKPVCNKARDVLLNIASFPISSHPGLQPELNTDTLKYSAPIPESCFLDEDREMLACQKLMEREWEKEYYTKTSLF